MNTGTGAELKSSFLTVPEVMAILNRSQSNRSQSYCYRLTKELNKELEEQGYITAGNGRILKSYFCKRIGMKIE